MRQTMVLCDLDADDSRRPATEVVQMLVGGEERELDVCAEHFAVLRSLPPVSGKPVGARKRPSSTASKSPTGRTAARPARRSARPAAAARSKESSNGVRKGNVRQPNSRRAAQERLAMIREWARAQGREVSDRGRLPSGLVEEYESANR